MRIIVSGQELQHAVTQQCRDASTSGQDHAKSARAPHVTPLAAVEAMRSRVDSITGAHHIGTCQYENKLPTAQISAPTRLPPKAPLSSAPYVRVDSSPAHHTQRMLASAKHVLHTAAKRPGTAPAAGPQNQQQDEIVVLCQRVLASSVAQGSSEGQRGQLSPCDVEPTPQVSDTSKAPAGLLSGNECKRRLNASRSARSAYLQRYLESPASACSNRASMTHGSLNRPVEKPAALAEESPPPLAVSAFWDSSEARNPGREANAGTDLLGYMKNASKTVNTSGNGDGRDSSRPCTVPNLSSARRPSGQDTGRVRPSTSTAGNQPHLDTNIGPWDFTAAGGLGARMVWLGNAVQQESKCTPLSAGGESAQASGVLFSTQQTAYCQASAREPVTPKTDGHSIPAVAQSSVQPVVKPDDARPTVEYEEAVQGGRGQCPADDEWQMLNSDSVSANASVMRHLARVAARKYSSKASAQ